MKGLKDFFGNRRRRRSASSNCHESMSNDLPHIPATLWVVFVAPYLDRVSQNRLFATCTEIRETFQQVGIENEAWPEGRFKFKRPVIAVAFAPDSYSLAIVPANSTTFQIWNRRRGYNQTLKGHGGIVSDVSFCTVNGLLASCSRTDGTVRIWTNQPEDDTEVENNRRDNYRCLRQLILRVFAMRYVRFSPCGQMIATWGQDPSIRLHHIDKPPEYSNLGNTPWKSRLRITCWDCVAFPKRAKQKTILAHAFNNEHVRLWNWGTQTIMQLQDTERTVAVGDYESYISCLRMLELPSGEEYLVVGCRVATVKMWALNDYSCVRAFRLGGGWSAVTHITFSSDGSKMACSSEGSQIRVFDFNAAECVATIKRHKERVEALSFVSNGQTLASGACDRTVRLTTIPVLQKIQERPLTIV